MFDLIFDVEVIFFYYFALFPIQPGETKDNIWQLPDFHRHDTSERRRQLHHPPIPSFSH